MNDETDAKKQKETLHAYCDCAKRETTWVRASRVVCGEWKTGWVCLNCNKFRPDR